MQKRRKDLRESMTDSTIEMSSRDNVQVILLRGYCTSYQKLACFVLYLKIINNFLKNKLRIL